MRTSTNLRLVSDKPRRTVAESATSPPPSRRNDEDDDGTRPPSVKRPATAQQNKQMKDAPDFYPEGGARATTKAKPSSVPKDLKRPGPEFFLDSRVSSNDLDDKKSAIPKDGFRRSTPNNVARRPAIVDDEKVPPYEKAKQSRRQDVIPSGLFFSGLKPPQKILEGNDYAELSPDSSAQRPVSKDGDKTNPACSRDKKSKGKNDGNVVCEPTLVDMPLDESTLVFETSSPANERQSTFQPRPPRNETIVGAVRVPGIDGISEDDYLDDQITEVMPTTTTEARSSLPVARIADDSNQEYPDDLGQAEPLTGEQLRG